MRRMWTIALAVLLASGSAFGQSAPVEVAPAKPAGLPPGVLAVVEIASVQALQKHVADFVTATEAIPPGQIPQILGVFAEPFHSTDLSQMDVTQPVRYVLVKGAPRSVETVLECAVKDPAVYLSTLDPGLKKGEEKDGVITFTENQETVAVGQSGKVICVGESAAAVGKVLALVNSNALPPEAMLQGGDVVASVEVKALLGHLADEKGSVLGALKESLMGAFPGTSANPAQAQAVDAQVDALESVLKQFERATVSLAPDAEQITLSAKMSPVQGSALAAYLASVPSGMPATLKYMPADSLIMCAFKLGNLKPLTIPFVSLNTKLLTAGGMEPAQVAQLSDQAANLLKALGDEAAFALRSGQSLRAMSAISFKEPEVYTALLRKTPDLFGALTSFYRNMGIGLQVKSDVVKYNDHEITQLSWAFDIKPPAGTSPKQDKETQEEQELMAAMQQKMLKSVFGEGMSQDVVILGNDAVSAEGSDALDAVKQIIDGKFKKLTDQEDFAKTAASIPAESCCFCLIHLTGMVELAMDMARTLGQLPIPEMHVQRGPGVTAFFVTAPAGSSVTCNVRVPAAEIKALAQGFKSLQVPPPRESGAEMPGTQAPPSSVPPAPQK